MGYEPTPDGEENLLIITGAGASHDVADPREINVHSDFMPPLTSYLFTGGGGQLIESVNKFLITNPIAAQVGKDWRRSKQPLEEYLSNLKNSKSLMLRKRYWAVPIYLHELFITISNTYINSDSSGLPSNYASLITAIAKNGNYGQIIWLNLNYDILADYAIKQATNNELRTFADYMNLETPDKIKIKYTKPHGSVDWFRPYKQGEISWGQIKQTKISDNFENALSTEIYTIQFARENSFMPIENHLYPAILAPLGKYDYVYRNHIESIISDLEKIQSLSLLCIGFSALDQDILDLIKNHVRFVKKLKIVNGSPEQGRKAHLNIVRYCERIQIDPERAVFNGGFTTFINEGIDEWLA